MSNHNNHITRERVLELLAEARELTHYYDAANRANPRGSYKYGSVDAIVLNLLERREYFITIGVKLHNRDVEIFGRRCYPGSEGFMVLDGTVKYILEGFATSRTIARFAESVCDVIDDRVDHGTHEVREIMMQNIKAYTTRTRGEIAKAYNGRTRKRISPYSIS